MRLAWVRRIPAAWLEIALLVGLYLAYTSSRLLAADDPDPAIGRGRDILRLEGLLGLDWEHAMVAFSVDHSFIALLLSYWYCVAHYVVTPLTLLWLYRRGGSAYLSARRSLMLATAFGLAMYLLLPTAPPRLVGGFADVLAIHADAGWWGSDASAPRGLGSSTNEMAALPSLHAGWSLWVALAMHRWSSRPSLRAAGWAHAALTTFVVIATANHWVVDVFAGWLVVAAGTVAATLWTRGAAVRRDSQPQSCETTARAVPGPSAVSCRRRRTHCPGEPEPNRVVDAHHGERRSRQPAHRDGSRLSTLELAPRTGVAEPPPSVAVATATSSADGRAATCGHQPRR